MTATVLIRYEDMYGNQYQTAQELTIHVEREEDSAKVYLTFGDEILGREKPFAKTKMLTSPG